MQNLNHLQKGQSDDPTPPWWPLWRTTYLCTTSPLPSFYLFFYGVY